ncbi:hypothetical protein CYMTET_38262 [Cymbomonas tetramitiformis]|uniref:DNA excision repair protein ERCC-8 n=1 Tax=Cymbomonas tetramitiformis TaxID=36881 RepID=A0AAE0CE38_9CHLO|nr:hypothetical protein CYMTET_38262 [Cymbomonas tetramitiformis]
MLGSRCDSFWRCTFDRELGIATRGREWRQRRRRAREVDLSTSKELDTTAHKAGINSLDLELVENRYLLAASADGTIAAYDVSLPSKCGAMQQHNSVFSKERCHRFSISSIRWYPVDTGMFVTGSVDQTVKVWDSNMLEEVSVFPCPGHVHAVAMSRMATGHCLIATASSDPQVRLIDLLTGGFTHTLTGHRDSVWAVQWSATCEWTLFTGGCDGAIRVWDVRRAGTLMVLDQHNAEAALQDMVVAATAHDHGGSQPAYRCHVASQMREHLKADWEPGGKYACQDACTSVRWLAAGCARSEARGFRKDASR